MCENDRFVCCSAGGTGGCDQQKFLLRDHLQHLRLAVLPWFGSVSDGT